MSARVVVGIDGSPEARSALRWAGWYAGVTGAELHAVHAWQRGMALDLEGPPPCDAEDLAACIEEELQRRVAEIAGPEVIATCAALTGTPASAIVRYAERRSAELIVVGACGTGTARRALLGSVSRQLTEAPRHAVTVVPDHEDGDLGGRPIVVGTDGSDGAARAVRWAADTAARAGVEVVAVHAFVPPDPDMSGSEQASLIAETTRRLDEEWCGPLRTNGVRYRTVVAREDPRALLRSVADAERPACVVLGSRGLGALTQRLLGSVTHGLVRSLDWPVVIVPAPRERPIWPPPVTDT